MAMHPALQVLSNLFPLRHYFLIYVQSDAERLPDGLCLEALFGLCCCSFYFRYYCSGGLRTVMLNYDYIP